MNQVEDPLVTAVIPVYNHEKFVIESIKSILNQSYKNIELIIINDGSKDHSHEAVLTLVDKCKARCRRFKYINRDNMGLTATLNQALSMAKGKYFSILASDDIALQDKFSVLVEALEIADKTYAAAFGNALLIDEHTTRIWLNYRGIVSSPNAGDGYNNYLDFRTDGGKVADYQSDDFYSYQGLLSHNGLPAMSFMIRTDLIWEVGGWTAGNASEDWELWRKLTRQYKLLYIDKPLALYRWHKSNSVKELSNTLKSDDLLNLMREKQYCARHAMMPLWRNQYAERLLQVMIDKGIPLNRKYASLDIVEILHPSFFRYFARRVTQKVMKSITNGKL